MLRAILCVWTSMACLACSGATAPSRTRRPPLVLPVTFRFEAELFDVPLWRAEELVRPAQPSVPTLAARIDEVGFRERLTELSRVEESIVRVTRPSAERRPGAEARLARRVGDLLSPTGTLASDALDITVRADLATGWQECDLALGIEGFPDGGARVTFPVQTPIPAGYWLEFDVLPARSSSAAAPRAVVGFVRAVAIWPETGDL